MLDLSPPLQSMRTATIAIVLLEGFSTLSLGSVVEPLSRLQSKIPESALIVTLYGLRTAKARSRSGLTVECQSVVSELLGFIKTGGRPRMIVMCGDQGVSPVDKKRTVELLRLAKRGNVPIVSIGDITKTLAETGIYDAHSMTTHWRCLASLTESNPTIDVKNQLFVSDNTVTTCAGESAALDMTLDLIERMQPDIATDVSAELLLSFSRRGDTRQPGSQSHKLRCAPQKVSKAVSIMCETIDDPVSMSTIASKCGASNRHLERLFKTHLGTSPHKYYKQLRLERVLELVTQTHMALPHVAAATGYASVPIMVQAFKVHFGETPREARSRSIAVAADVQNHRLSLLEVRSPGP